MVAGVSNRPADNKPLRWSSGAHEERVTTRVLLWTCVAVVAVRTIFVFHPLRPDEGGYLLAARHWAPGRGEFLYGEFHVDRPPALMMFFRLAALWEADAAIRVITIPVVVVIVLAIAYAARLVAGPTAARWAAVVAAALMCSPALAADQADGEMFALLFVTSSIAAILHARRALDRGTAMGFGLVAGVLAAAGPLVKQNLFDAVVFATVLLAVSAARDPWARARCGVLAGSFGVGMLAVFSALAAWAVLTEVGVGLMWADLVHFRAQAGEVLVRSHRSAPLERAQVLLITSVVSAVVPIIVVWLASPTRRSRRYAGRAAEHWALLAMMGWSVPGIVGGGSFWLHYLIPLVPVAAMAAGLVLGDRGPGARLMHALALWTVAAAGLAVATTTIAYQTMDRLWAPQLIGQWIAESAEKSDTVVVAYGSPHVVESADLTTPYPYLWSLQMRTLDPEQRRLERLLAGPSRPTWFVVLNGVNSWDIDDDGRVRALLDKHYEMAASLCGYQVMVRGDVQRQLAEAPPCQ